MSGPMPPELRGIVRRVVWSHISLPFPVEPILFADKLTDAILTALAEAGIPSPPRPGAAVGEDEDAIPLYAKCATCGGFGKVRWRSEHPEPMQPIPAPPNTWMLRDVHPCPSKCERGFVEVSFLKPDLRRLAQGGATEGETT